MKSYRVYATCDIGEEGLKRLTDRGYEVDVYPEVEPPPKALIVEKVASGIDALITTLRDPIDEEVFQAGQGTLKVVSQIAVGVDNIDEKAARKYRVPYTHTAVVLTDATAEFAFFIMGCVSRKLYPSERLVREGRWETWHPYLPFLGDEVTGKTVAVIGTGTHWAGLSAQVHGIGHRHHLLRPVAGGSGLRGVSAGALRLQVRTGLVESARHHSLDIVRGGVSPSGLYQPARPSHPRHAPSHQRQGPWRS